MNIEMINHRFKIFRDGVRISMLIDRSVGNTNKGSRRWVNKIISTNVDEWIDAIEKLLTLQYYLNSPNIRLYSCVNDRDMTKGIKHFQHQQLDLLPENRDSFYKNINDKFCSSIMQPENRASSLFLLDIDSKFTSEVDKFCYDNDIIIVSTYPSKKGWHYIVKPFNVALANDCKTFEVKKDGLLLINWIEEK